MAAPPPASRPYSRERGGGGAREETFWKRREQQRENGANIRKAEIPDSSAGSLVVGILSRQVSQNICLIINLAEPKLFICIAHVGEEKNTILWIQFKKTEMSVIIWLLPEQEIIK